jgi:hypothetical protein
VLFVYTYLFSVYLGLVARGWQLALQALLTVLIHTLSAALRLSLWD